MLDDVFLLGNIIPKHMVKVNSKPQTKSMSKHILYQFHSFNLLLYPTEHGYIFKIAHLSVFLATSILPRSNISSQNQKYLQPYRLFNMFSSFHGFHSCDTTFMNKQSCLKLSRNSHCFYTRFCYIIEVNKAIDSISIWSLFSSFS